MMSPIAESKSDDHVAAAAVGSRAYHMQAAAREGGLLSPSDAARNAQNTIAHQQQLLQHARHQARVGSMQAP